MNGQRLIPEVPRLPSPLAAVRLSAGCSNRSGPKIHGSSAGGGAWTPPTAGDPIALSEADVEATPAEANLSLPPGAVPVRKRSAVVSEKGIGSDISGSAPS